MNTKVYRELSATGIERFYFKHKRQQVELFENSLGRWVAEGLCRHVLADTMQEAISRYKYASN